MGISASNFLGPYLWCRTFEIDSTKTARTCSNEKCKHYKSGHNEKKKRFCEICGYPFQEREVPIKKTNVNPNELSEEFANRLSQPGGDEFYYRMREQNFHIWMPQAGLTRDPDFGGEQDSLELPIAEGAREAEVIEFQQVFTKEIVRCHELYGAENVEVRWGFIVFYS